MTLAGRRGLGLALLLLVLAPAARAVSLPLPTRLANALAVPGAPARLSGAMAVDLQTGSTVFARNPDLPLAPASNEKLVVTYAAYQELGPAFRFSTQVLGKGLQDGPVWRGNLVLRGAGDPTLTSIQLQRLATQLKRLGIRRVTGRVLGDESWFDARRTAPGWKRSFYLLQSPPISALVVDGGVYRQRVALSPPLAAAARFRQLLRTRGITTGPVGVGVASADAVELAAVKSQPLTEIVREMDVESDNLTAEMLLKELGAIAGKGGSTAAGAAIAAHDLQAAGIPLAGVRIVDGSGLSSLDRLTARAITSLLLALWHDTALRGVFFHSLPVSGISGTLKDRMERKPARGVVHAKTGTTDRATALSGFVRTRYAFALLQNGDPVSWNASRKAQDRFATALAAIR